MGVSKSELYPIVKNSGKIAVIFIHGWNGDPITTWKRKDRFTKSLPELIGYDPDLKEFDVYSYGYKSGITPMQYDFITVAKLLHTEIEAKLKGMDIVFIAHSMGGLVVQQYIINRYEGFEYENLKRIVGVAYLAVPFMGAGLASVLPQFMVNKQIATLRKENSLLMQMKEKWHKYLFRGGDESLPKELQYKIPQVAFYGVKDGVVSDKSALPLHLGAKEYEVDEDHSSICKVDENHSVFMHLKGFLIDITKSSEEAMILHVHGYDKQDYSQQPNVELDWTRFFDVYPRRLPTSEEWHGEIMPQLNLATSTWSREWVKKGGRVRLYSKLCLPGGLLIGNRFSRTKGSVIEVAHNNQIWTSEKFDSNYQVVPKRSPGNNPKSTRAVMILSVTHNIQNAVEQHLARENFDYRMIVNILPPNGPGQTSIENSEQAVAYAAGVKTVADDLRSQGIEEIYLFLNCPFSVAVFVGHYLTVMCPIQVFDFANPGYVPSCRI